ncbi:hypothetical protein FS749_015705 [Ceratobasidium sp. UAMH 11750]|nr:hypothetical protein FS749_015705 [Ceratobasidium sp. UAMH 11750]
MAKKHYSRARPSSSTTPSSTTAPTAATFAGLNINSDGSERITRNAPPTGTAYERRRKEEHETLRKTRRDMERSVLNFVSAALRRVVTLPFRISDFEKMRNANKIPVQGGGPLKALGGVVTRLRAADGPAVVVDLDQMPILWYFPEFIGKGLRRNLLESLSELAKVYRPDPDSKTRDRRSNMQPGCPPQYLSNESSGPVTRSKAAKGTAPSEETNPGQATDEDGTEDDVSSESNAETVHPANLPPLERYQEVDGDIRWSGSGGVERVPEHLHTAQTNDTDGPLDLALLEPFAYYLSPAWYQTGMQYKYAIQMSAHFRDALKEHCAQKTIRLLEAKRLYDYQLEYLTDIIHASLGTSMRKLREECMAKVTGPAHVVLENGWTSAFPCFGIGVNRTSPLHRDSKGMRAGMDVIGVLGTFTEGGELNLEDAALEVEWVPGCLGAFDGYDFRHEVREWKGGSRVALISFCRKSTWDGLKLDPALSRPTLADVSTRLQEAKDIRSHAAEQRNNRQKEQQAVDRQERADKKARLGAERADPVLGRLQERQGAMEQKEQAKRWAGWPQERQGAKKRRLSGPLHERHVDHDRR